MKNVNLFSILKYYIVSILMFSIFAIILKRVENYFLLSVGGFITTILKLGLIFIVITLVTSLILYATNDSARSLFRRLFNLIKSKLKR